MGFFRADDQSLESGLDSMPSSITPTGVKGEYTTRGTISEIVHDSEAYLVLLDTGVFALCGNDCDESMLEIALLQQAKSKRTPVTLYGSLCKIDAERIVVENAQSYGIDIEKIQL